MEKIITKQAHGAIEVVNATDQPVNSFYKIKEVSEMLRVHYNVVYGLVMDGKLRASKVGRSWRISQQDLDRYIDKRANTIS